MLGKYYLKIKWDLGKYLPCRCVIDAGAIRIGMSIVHEFFQVIFICHSRDRHP